MLLTCQWIPYPTTAKQKLKPYGLKPRRMKRPSNHIHWKTPPSPHLTPWLWLHSRHPVLFGIQIKQAKYFPPGLQCMLSRSIKRQSTTQCWRLVKIRRTPRQRHLLITTATWIPVEMPKSVKKEKFYTLWKCLDLKVINFTNFLYKHTYNFHENVSRCYGRMVCTDRLPLLNFGVILVLR